MRATRTILTAAVLLAATLTTATSASAQQWSTGGSTTAREQYRVITTFPTALANGLRSPNGTPPGVNRTDCKLTPQRPRPVVLAGGSLFNRVKSFSGLGPYLANQGFCVFAPNIGYFNGLPQLGRIEKTAEEFSAYVNEVLAGYPGVTKVDIVGYSQGGLMSRQYIKFLGGEAKVNRLIGLAPTNNGTTLSGLATLGLTLGIDPLVAAISPALSQQTAGSQFLKTLNADDPTPGNVKYDVIATTGDQIVTPYRSSFITGASSWTVQTGCRLDGSDHLQLPYSRRVMTYTANLLDGANRRVPCSLVLPYVG